jgi:Fungal N-terminal domain of STAND proteins
MVEPLSIAAGIFSVVSSLNSLSERINDFRNAGSEIRQLQQEVNDLTLVLGKLDDARAQGTLQGTPLISLGPVLQNLNMEVVKTDVFLKEATKKTFRGPYWAFTGKSQCNRLLGRLESRKSTLTVTLELLQKYVLTYIFTNQINNRFSAFRLTRFKTRLIKYSPLSMVSEGG